MVTRLLLRLLALPGAIAVLAWQIAWTPPITDMQTWGIAVLLAAGFAVVFFLCIGAPRAFATLLRYPDLLVPLGVTTTLAAGVSGLASLPELGPLAAPLWQGTVLRLTVEASVPLFFFILIAVLHAGWTTSLVLQAVEHDRVDLLAPLAHPGRWLLVTFAALTIGVLGVLFLSVVGLAVATAALPLGMVVIGVTSLVWNLLTAALLPGALRSRGSFPRALADGLAESVRGMGRWWGVVVVQMLLLGWLTFLYLDAFGRTTTHWQVNGFWTGGYEGGCRWYSEVMQLTGAGSYPPLETALALLLGILAVAVKLTVAQRMDWWVEPVGRLSNLPGDRVAGWKLAPQVSALILAVVTGAAVVALCGAVIFHEPVTAALFTWDFRRAVDRGESPEALHARLDGRHEAPRNSRLGGGSMKLNLRLSQDPNPRVRRAVLAYLVSDIPLVQKRERYNDRGPSWTGKYLGDDVVTCLTRLLDDADPDVRQEAIRAVSERPVSRNVDDKGSAATVFSFEEPLLRHLRRGEPADRAAVAESLIHWQPSIFLEILGDRAQPKEVRLALLRGAERYGWAWIPDKADPRATLERLLDEPDQELRRAVIEAGRRCGGGPALWLKVVNGPDADDRRIAFRTWVDALVEEPLYLLPEYYGGRDYPLLEETEDLLYLQNSAASKANGALDGERVALVLYVLVSAARKCTARLERLAPVAPGLEPRQWQPDPRTGRPPSHPATGPFARQLHGLQLTLRALTGVRLFASDPRNRQVQFTARMPNEQGPAGPRNLRDFLYQEVREPLAWCRRHGTAYGSSFLRVNGRRFGHLDPATPNEFRPQPVLPSRTLGQVLEALDMHTDEAFQQYNWKRYRK